MSIAAPHPYSLTGKRIWVAGHRGMVGSAIVRRLEREDCTVLTVPRQQVDLRRQAEVEAWMAAERPQAIFIASATVGGILANSTRPAEFIYDNLAIETNIIHTAYTQGVEKLLFLGSTCIYPRLAPQPIPEEALLTAPLEPTNEWYAVAKIAGIKMCQAYRRQYGCNFISAMPTNLYGPGDNYDLQGSHVLPAFIAKIHHAKVSGAETMEIWGSGTPQREFLHVDDLAEACLFLIRNDSSEIPHNIGSGQEVTIRQLAETIAEVLEYKGRFVFDATKPDGMPRKLCDTSKINAMGWRARIGLKDGIAHAYQWFLAHHAG